ncbi:L-fucose kinase-like [Mercenaria mercenaria]|uniref:L-fucose kinase-like n=1 Tax=Mercenaria mercenaria TaxID=6596 RepID=UPI00234F02F5|nr:L-fucose kinase-like [Mercenaria mercenaria]XP_045193478.2 L-fucose kinase-like [Mercenaria mercenaria]
MEAKKVRWTAIVITSPDKEWSHTLQRELELRQSKGYIEKDTFLLAVEDPKAYVGSGGATINALLTVTEYISAQRGYSVLTTEVLQDSYILILHNGRTYPYDPCGRPFTTLPVKLSGQDPDGLTCMIDMLIKLITEKIAVRSSPGVWVSSTDMILTVPYDAEIPWEECNVCAITVPSTPGYCRHHGVYKLSDQGFVEDILYKETIKNLEICERKDGTVPMVCAMVYFSAEVSETLLSFCTKPPLDACTYIGADSGVSPIKLSLFFDVMLPMCSGVNARDFRSGARSGSYGKDVAVGDIKTMRQARTILWDDLHKYKIKACMIEDGSCIFPHTIQEHKRNIQDRLLQQCFPEGMFQWQNWTHSHVKNPDQVDVSSILINSVLGENVTVGPKCVLTHCNLQGHVTVGKDSFISGLVTDPQSTDSVTFADSIIVQCNSIFVPMLGKSIHVTTTHGRFDNIDDPMWKSVSSFCNDPWVYMMNRTGIIKEDLWGQEVETDDQTIFTAQLFPVFHASEIVGLQEILWLQGVITDNDNKDILRRWRSSWRLSMKDIHSLTDLKEQLEFRRKLFYTVGQHDITKALLQQENKGFRVLYSSAVIDGYTELLLNTLDTVGEGSDSELQAGMAARTLANIADVLGCMAGPKGGLRSGPAANTTWAKAFQLLETRNIKGGIEALAKERSKWLSRPDTLIRAARHYEGAAQILIRQAVMTAKQFFKLHDETPVGQGSWVLAECPARIDISGGWSDTPPITYEHGGAVATVGLLIDGKRPIGAKTRRIVEPKLVLVIHGSSDQKQVVCQETADLADYYNPHSPGALLKAAFVCAEIVDLKSNQSLKEQLETKYDGGFELHSWTNLPHGSGLGTSSILAGVVMASLLKAAGKSCDTTGLLHAVLYLEQLLTTGGGWQDQIGGLTGGVKLGVSAAKLPLFVEVVDLEIKQEIIQAFNERIVLIYTGKTRLARNLLQDVLRNWYARNPQIVETEDKLVQLANDCAKHFQKGAMAEVGKCMDSYWQMKKTMAPGCEPEFVTKIMSAVHPHALGMCMAGAGGGGFMYVLARDHESQKNIRNLIDSMESSDGTKVYDTCIDEEGLKITVIEEDEGSLTVSDLDEDMHDYYNQPETLLEDIPETTDSVPVVVGVPLLDVGVSMATGDASVPVATGEIDVAQSAETDSADMQSGGDSVTMTTSTLVTMATGDSVTKEPEYDTSVTVSDIPTAGLSGNALAAIEKAKQMQKELEEFFNQGRDQENSDEKS